MQSLLDYQQRDQEMGSRADLLSPHTVFMESAADLANCEKDLETLGKLRLQTLETIIQEKLQEIDRIQNDCLA